MAWKRPNTDDFRCKPAGVDSKARWGPMWLFAVSGPGRPQALLGPNAAWERLKFKDLSRSGSIPRLGPNLAWTRPCIDELWG